MRAALLALSLLAAAAQADDSLVFALPFVAGLDLDAGKRAELLASPALKVELMYEPALKLWGWTGRLGYCSPRHICIKKKWRPVLLEGEALARAPDHIRFTPPRRHWFGLMPYRPAGPVRLSLPPLWPGELPRHIDSELALIAAQAPQQTVQDAHLSPPYVAAAAFGPAGSAGYALPACDPTLHMEGGFLSVRPYRQAEAYGDWLRGLAESEWWAEQIPGVERLRASRLREGVALDITQVGVQQAGQALLHIQVRRAALPDASCPGSTVYQFSWRNGELIAASLHSQPDIFAEDCQATARRQEALWWQGQLQRHVRSDDPLAPLHSWEAWRAQAPQCLLPGMSPEPSDALELLEVARAWQQLAAEAAE